MRYKSPQQLQKEDLEAYHGARCFYNFFCFTAVLCYTIQSLLFITPFPYLLLFTLLLSSLLSKYFYEQCHSIPTHIISTSPTTSQQLDLESLSSHPAPYLCKHCNNEPRPLRVKHCLKCNNCIVKYDHHCFWIGNCVGEMNQSQFVGFLVCQTVMNVAAAVGFWTVESEGIIWWVAVGNVGMVVMAVGFAVFTGFLLLYHLMLAATNQTTWEHIRRDRISYLKDLPRGCHPFSNGLLPNLKQFFRPKTIPTHWKINPNNTTTQFDFFDNQYYSCC